MKIKIRPEDVSAVEMSDWIAELRDDARSESAGDGGRKPETTAPAAPATRSSASAQVSGRAEIKGRAAIGDQLRKPIAWCEMGSCISHHADPAALGEADIRARAISAGWRLDALSRLACLRCQQSVPWFWAAHPVALWDREVAVTRAALMVAAVREDVSASSAGGTQTAVIPGVQPAAAPPPDRQIRGRHRKGP